MELLHLQDNQTAESFQSKEAGPPTYPSTLRMGHGGTLKKRTPKPRIEPAI
ncbi:hypothetical protein PHLCEN_2v1774 [Hermanssonia centrifuga]|uniref:Uncharacterized protein n=1 Tax=Hermanssonia centrifuga TaxID=98765 RepID=A0A2R6RVU9_9APHY|nr:hypothetical protein PHLCEN_2v1774 [Hermanssonia centrifuga]